MCVSKVWFTSVCIHGVRVRGGLLVYIFVFVFLFVFVSVFVFVFNFLIWKVICFPRTCSFRAPLSTFFFGHCHHLFAQMVSLPPVCLQTEMISILSLHVMLQKSDTILLLCAWPTLEWSLAFVLLCYGFKVSFQEIFRDGLNIAPWWGCWVHISI